MAPTSKTRRMLQFYADTLGEHNHMFPYRESKKPSSCSLCHLPLQYHISSPDTCPDFGLVCLIAPCLQTSSENKLLFNIKKNLGLLGLIQQKCDEEFGGEDGIYRFYHHSFKAYRLQNLTSEIVGTLRSLHPGHSTDQLNSLFESVIAEGTGTEWDHSHNLAWGKHVRPVVEAYFHAKWVLDMTIKYGQWLHSPPDILPSGWATVLYIYNIR